MQSTLTIDGDDGVEDAVGDVVDDGVVGDVSHVELKRSSGARVKRATAAEKRERAGHHLFARKATEWLTVTGERACGTTAWERRSAGSAVLASVD